MGKNAFLTIIGYDRVMLTPLYELFGLSNVSWLWTYVFKIIKKTLLMWSMDAGGHQKSKENNLVSFPSKYSLRYAWFISILPFGFVFCFNDMFVNGWRIQFRFWMGCGPTDMLILQMVLTGKITDPTELTFSENATIQPIS